MNEEAICYRQILSGWVIIILVPAFCYFVQMDKTNLLRPYYKSLLEARALGDPGFREILLRDPATAFAMVAGFELPQGLELHVLEESEQRMFMVLPPSAPDLKEEDITIFRQRSS